MPPKKKQGVLAKQLDAYLALPNSLTNQKKMREAKSRLITAASKRIDGCKGQLSEQDIKTLKEAVNRFVSSKNEVLSRKVMQALDKNNWKALRIEIVSFSRAKREHMDKMRIEFSKITPHPSLLQAVDRLDPMYQLEFAGPPKILLDFFIKIFYPILSPRRQSEQMARWKMAGYFHLLDAETPDNCWVLLDELPLFDLSSTSAPSEVKTTNTTKPRLENSMFLTGRADLAIITLAGRNAPVMKDRDMKTKLVESFKVGRPFTYEVILDRVRHLEFVRDGVKVRVGGVQFLVIEAKSKFPEPRDLPPAPPSSEESGESADEASSVGDRHFRHRSGGTNVAVEKEYGFVNEVEEPSEYTDGETERETGDESEQGNSGIGDDLEGEGDQGNEKGKGEMGGKTIPSNGESDEEGEHGEGEEKSGESEDEIEDDYGNDESLERILKDAMPQIVSEAIALSGSLSDRVMKFILSDGDNWIFGILDCTKEKGGRLCSRTVVRVLQDSENAEREIRQGVLTVMRLLALWAILPGAQLEKLFTNE